MCFHKYSSNKFCNKDISASRFVAEDTAADKARSRLVHFDLLEVMTEIFCVSTAHTSTGEAFRCYMGEVRNILQQEEHHHVR